MKKRILLTGGSGFVGKNLIEYFEKNHPGEYYVDAPRSFELNVISKEEVQNWIESHERYDLIIHYAVYTDAVDKNKDGSKMYEYNFQSFMNFYELREKYDRMLYAGSGAEFDKSKDIISAREDEIYCDNPAHQIPQDPYGLMKYNIGKLIEDSDNIINTRIFGLFGKYEYSFRFITDMCQRSIDGRLFQLNQNVYFDYLYIDDFCKMIDVIIKNDSTKFNSYNIVSGKKISLLEICDIVNRIAERHGNIAQEITVKKSGLNNEYTASNERFIREFGDFNYMSMEEAIEDLYKYLQSRH